MTKQFICCLFALLMLVSVCMVGCEPSNQKYTLTTEIENEICQSYWDTYVKESKSITLADLRTYCVYQAENIFAVFVDDPSLMYIQSVRGESIGGVIIYFPSGQPLYIYSQGKIYDLRTAYENKIIGMDYLNKLQASLDSFKRTTS